MTATALIRNKTICKHRYEKKHKEGKKRKRAIQSGKTGLTEYMPKKGTYVQNGISLETEWGKVKFSEETSRFAIRITDHIQDKLSSKLRKMIINRKIAVLRIKPLQGFSETLQNSVEGTLTELSHMPSDLGEVVGWDTEYRAVLDEDGRPERNMILSYQFWSLNRSEGILVIPQDGKHVSFSILRDMVFFWLRELGSKVERISLVAHFTLAECASSGIRKEFKDVKTLQVIQKSFVAVTPSSIETWDRSRNKREFELSLHDTLLLSGSQPLKSLAGNVGLKKLDLSAGEWISRMDVLMIEDPALYIDYAMMDSIITSSYFVKLIKEARQMVGDDKYVPATVSGLSARCVEARFNKMSDEGVGSLSPRVVERHCVKGKDGSLVTRKSERVPEQVWRNVIALYGGRNETYRYGLLEKGAYDYDLCGAYATVILSLDEVDWNDTEQVSSVDDVNWNDVGYAKVQYSFKKNCYFPLFPSWCFDGITRITDYGLCFPRRGISYVTFPELYAAREAGVLEKCEIKESLRFKRKGRSTLSLIVADLIRERAKYPRGSFLNQLYKLICNSIYGKICQGLSGKKGINLHRSLEGVLKRDRISMSRISNPAVASYITGMVRACVGEYLIALDKAGRAQDVVNVTTDGFMVTRKELTDGWVMGEGFPLAGRLSETRVRYLGEGFRNVLELKHQTTAQSWAVKTRNYSMLPDSESDELLFAKGGVSFRGLGLTKEEEMERLTSMFLERTDAFVSSRLVSISEILSGKKDDLLNITEERSKNWDYDLKRRPFDVSVRSFTWNGKDYDVTCFYTRPWETSFDFLNSRKGYDSWKKATFQKEKRKNSNKLDSDADVVEFLDYLDKKKNSPTSRAEVFQKGVRKVFIYALSKRGWSAAQIANTLCFDRKECNSARRGKIYLEYVAGKSKLKRISEGVWEHNCTLICSLLAKLPKDLSDEIASEICPRSG